MPFLRNSDLLLHIVPSFLPNYHVVLVLVADNAIAQKPFRAFFQNFDNWTIQNSYKMSVSPASSKSIGVDFRVIFVTEFDIVKGKIIEQLDRKFKMKKIRVGFFDSTSTVGTKRREKRHVFCL